MPLNGPGRYQFNKHKERIDSPGIESQIITPLMSSTGESVLSNRIHGLRCRSSVLHDIYLFFFYCCYSSRTSVSEIWGGEAVSENDAINLNMYERFAAFFSSRCPFHLTRDTFHPTTYVHVRKQNMPTRMMI